MTNESTGPAADAPRSPYGPNQSRRLFLGSGVALLGCTQADGRGAGVAPLPAETAPRNEPRATAATVEPVSAPRAIEQAESLAQLEQVIGGRVGVFAFSGSQADSTSLLSHRENERFALCSTFKWALAALCLLRAERQELELSARLAFGRSQLQEHAPVAREQLTRGYLTVEDACRAAVEKSDNTATNLLLEHVGGPAVVTRFFRDQGDQVTRLDRTEPSLNGNLPGDARDTTSPLAMAKVFSKVVVGEVLGVDSRARLSRWLLESRTGDRRLRAGLGSELTAGGKTGTGANGAVNDLIVAWPKSAPPVFVAAYLSESRLPLERLEAAHQRIGELLRAHLEMPTQSDSL